MRHLRHSAAPAAAAVLTAAWLAGAGAPRAAGQAPAADAVRGLYVNACASCHGTDGRGNRQIDAPVLAGLSAGYLERQLHGFRLGHRGRRSDDREGGEMRPMVAGLDDAEFTALSAWLAALPPPAPSTEAEAPGDPARGQAGYAACAVCHGRAGEGADALGAPRLAGQAGWYTARQLHKFIDGVRGAHPDDASGASMRASVADLDPDDVPDIVAWIETLRGGR